MACFIGKIKSSSLSLNDLHCCSPAEPVTSDLFYGRIKAKLTSYRRLLANYSQMKNRFVCFLPKAMWGLKLSSKKREKKTTCIFKDYFTLACLFQSAPYPLNSQECINKQTNKQKDYVQSIPYMERHPHSGWHVNWHSIKICQLLPAYIPVYSDATVCVIQQCFLLIGEAKPWGVALAR